MKTRTRVFVFVVAIASVGFLLVAPIGGISQKLTVVQAHPDSSSDARPLQQCEGCGCTPSCSGNCCITASCSHKCSSGGSGGNNPPVPQPTHPPGGSGGSGGNNPPQPTVVAGPPATCGNGTCDAGESYWNCSSECPPPPTPTPIPWGAEITYYCIPWLSCSDGLANVTTLKGVDGGYAIVDVVCVSEEDCMAATPIPNLTPTPGGPNNNYPCNYPPTVDSSGVIRQPCEEWPGWFIDVEVRIPPSPILRNPWPRGLVGMENCLWYLGSADNEKWSEEKALECPAAADGVTHDSSTFDCGNGTAVTEGAKANYQIGAAWRQWRDGDDPVFGYTPPGEITWVIQDREWNGGTQMRIGPNICYTFETSSYGLEEWGPVWNPECQDEECDCDERILDYLGSPSYQVNATTFWYPEYSFKHLEYECSHMEWHSCHCWSEEPHGQGQRRSCSAPPGTCTGEGEWYGQVGTCDEWKWTEVQDAWTSYDLTTLGFANPVLPFVGVTVAGADAAGNRCGEFTDRWPCYIPIPVIEVQPASEQE